MSNLPAWDETASTGDSILGIDDNGDEKTNRIYKTLTASSRRFKTDITTIVDSEWLLKIRPVSFRLCGITNDYEPTGKFADWTDYGFIAEEAQELGVPDVLLHFRNEKLFSFRYTKLWAFIVDQIQKNYKRIEDLKRLLEQARVDKPIYVVMNGDGMVLHSSEDISTCHEFVGTYKIDYSKRGFTIPPHVQVSPQSSTVPLFAYVGASSETSVTIDVCGIDCKLYDPDKLYVTIKNVG